jgi:hypothetical protein
MKLFSAQPCTEEHFSEGAPADGLQDGEVVDGGREKGKRRRARRRCWSRTCRVCLDRRLSHVHVVRSEAIE